MNRAQRNRFKSATSLEHRWVISYADFITLLFAFFVFLFSVSSLQNEKFKEVSATLMQLFEVNPSSVDPIELLTTPQGPDLFNPIYQPEPLPGTQIDNHDVEKYATQSALLDVQAQMGEQFSQLIENQLFSVSGDESWLEIEISDSVTFISGTADITNQAEAVLYEIGKLLATHPYPVAVEGYSVASEVENSAQSWLLSAQRATNVIQYLQQAGIEGARLSAVSFAHYQPEFSQVSKKESGSISIVVAGFEQSISRP